MKVQTCGCCIHWQMVGLGREYGHCEAPIPQWVWREWRAMRYTKRTAERSSLEVESCDAFTSRNPGRNPG